jgi:hypothetical protein
MQQILRPERDELAVRRDKAGERPLEVCEAEVGADDEEADHVSIKARQPQRRLCPSGLSANHALRSMASAEAAVSHAKASKAVWI